MDVNSFNNVWSVRESVCEKYSFIIAIVGLIWFVRWLDGAR